MEEEEEEEVREDLPLEAELSRLQHLAEEMLRRRQLRRADHCLEVKVQLQVPRRSQQVCLGAQLPGQDGALLRGRMKTHQRLLQNQQRALLALPQQE